MKIGRNQPCGCGSGKKYKHCCIQRDIKAQQQTVEIADENFTDTVQGHELSCENDEEDFHEMLRQGLQSMHEMLLGKLPHIKAYKKLRKLHGIIMSSMAQYLADGKFVHARHGCGYCSKTKPAKQG